MNVNSCYYNNCTNIIYRGQNFCYPMYGFYPLRKTVGQVKIHHSGSIGFRIKI